MEMNIESVYVHRNSDFFMQPSMNQPFDCFLNVQIADVQVYERI